MLCAATARTLLTLQSPTVVQTFVLACLPQNVLRATTAFTFPTSQHPKVLRSCGAFSILTSKCASHPPRMVCFLRFDFTLCSAPQRRALFRHHNFQKWSESEHVVFWAFWLQKLLHATTPCTFQHLNFQKCSENGAFVAFWIRNALPPQWRAIFNLLSPQMAPHPPL